MRFATIYAVAGLTSLATAHPMEKREPLPSILNINDKNVAQLALYLKHLKLALYIRGYLNFTNK